jgi:PTS system trehalose-specific IIC component
MLSAMIGSAIAAGICGMAGVMANGIGVGGLPGILSIQPQYWLVYALAMLVAIAVPIALTVVLHKRADKKGEFEQTDIIDNAAQPVTN